MKIEDKRVGAQKVQYVEIEIGDCFEYEDEIYIKTDETNCSKNAFNYNTNKRGYFYGGEAVTPVNAKVVIE